MEYILRVETFSILCITLQLTNNNTFLRYSNPHGAINILEFVVARPNFTYQHIYRVDIILHIQCSLIHHEYELT